MAIQSVSVRRAIVRSCEKIVPHVMTGMVPSRVPVIRTPHACFTCQSAANCSFLFLLSFPTTATHSLSDHAGEVD